MEVELLDAFNSEVAEKRYLLSKPTCFLVLGKQGCGKSALAKRFARTWKCILVTPANVIEEALTQKNALGVQANSYLLSGNAVPDVIVLKLLEEKLCSEEVKHHGYILDGFPLLVPDEKVIKMQLDFIRNLPLKPDFLIYLKIPDPDLLERRLGFKVDPVTNIVYPRSFYEPPESDKPLTKSMKTEEEEEEEEEEGGEEEEEGEEEEIEEDDMFDDINFDESIDDIINRLLVRRDDSQENIMKSVGDYRDHILKKMEDYLGSHDQRKVIELDANLPAKEIFKNLLSCLQPSLLNGTRIPLRLQGKEDQEEIGEDIDTDDMLRSLAAFENIAPGFRWRRSKWGRLCPVALSEGNNIMGNPLFAVSFLDKMYVMSSAEALEKFMKNPRQYLLPPQPAPPCKVVVIGPPYSGCTTLSERLCERYNAKRIDVHTLIAPIIKEQREKMIEQCTAELIQASINTVKAEEEAHKKKLALEAAQDDGESDSDEQPPPLPPPPQEDIPIDENHPQVQKLVEASMGDIEAKQVKTPPEQYVDCLEKAMAEIYAGTDKGPSSGGWVIDNFPHNRDQFSIMVERGIFPDEVIILKDDTNDSDILVKRAEEKGEFTSDTQEIDSTKLQAYKEKISDIEHQLTSLQTSLRNAHNIEPLNVSCEEKMDDAFMMCVKNIEAAFQYRGWEYTGMDQDEEEEDINAAEEEDLDDDEDEDPNLKKPFGETLRFCPVMLKENNVLAPGSSEYAVKYRERVYFLSNSDNRQKFLDNSEYYLPQSEPVKLPPVRLLLHGAKGSGKTLHGKFLAKKYSIFHISFKDRLQELILHKTMKKIGPDFEVPNEDKEDEKDNDYTETGDEVSDDQEAILQLTEFEENIRNNLLSGEELTKETLDAILIPWWKEEPYKSIGFILEGFPRTVEELKYMTSSGLFPDGSVLLQVDGEVICDRLFPPIYERWKVARDKRLRIRAEKRKEILQKREDEKIRKKAEKLLEIEERKAEKAAQRSESDEEDEVEDDEEYDIDELVEMEIIEEFGEIDLDEEEEETEEEATERIRNDLMEKFEDENVNLDLVQEGLDDENIPRLPVEAGRKPHITQYVLMKLLKPQIIHRDSLFDKCQSISQSLALKLLNQGYKHPSRFGRWCPVKLFDKDVLPPFVSKDNQTFPVIYRDYIYFLSSEENKDRFLACPQKFLCEASTKPLVPIKIMILGPPKSGKTTLANRFVKEFGLVRLSAGEILRKVILTHAKTALVNDILDYLKKGLTVPDELTIQALEVCLLDPQCVTRGFVLDGYPITSKQMNLLTDRSIIPYKVIHLDLSDKDIMERASVDRVNRTMPLHDSFTITAIRVASYRKDSVAIQKFYNVRHRNVFKIDGTESKWLIYHKATNEVQKAVDQIQTYIINIKGDKAAPIKHMCVTPEEFNSHLGEFDQYCPVSLDSSGELVDCSDDTSSDLVALYRGKYYKFASEENMQKFLALPSKYTPPLALIKLPPVEDLPIRRTATFVKQAFPKQIELQGYCPVTYLSGNLRYEAIVHGEPDLVAEYRGKLYAFASESNLDKFMRRPKRYSSLTLPSKLPPKRDPVSVTGLPMLGYMEQTVSTAIIKALTSVGCFKPKHPFLSAKRSALLYVAYYLKAHNPKASPHVRQKYKKMLATFEENCGLIQYLSINMRKRYMDTDERPIDFDHKLDSFLSLQPVN